MFTFIYIISFMCVSSKIMEIMHGMMHMNGTLTRCEQKGMACADPSVVYFNIQCFIRLHLSSNCRRSHLYSKVWHHSGVQFKLYCYNYKSAGL